MRCLWEVHIGQTYDVEADSEDEAEEMAAARFTLRGIDLEDYWNESDLVTEVED